MMEQQLAVGRIDPMPPEITSSEAKLVYLYVDVAGTATVDELSTTLSLKKMSVLSVLHSLSEQGLVQKTSRGFTTVD